MSQTRVVAFTPPKDKHSPFQAILSNETVVEAKAALISTGRLVSHSSPKDASDKEQRKETQKSSPPPCYFGFKTHLTQIDLDDCLEMHLIPNGYIGLSMVDRHTANLAGLVKLSKKRDRTETIEELLAHAPRLKERIQEAKPLFPWMEGHLPSFGWRTIPTWPNSYFIGDAAAVLPPASGAGLAMAITSGQLAALHAHEASDEAFRQIFLLKYGSALRWAKALHLLFTHPALRVSGSLAISLFGKLPDLLFQKTRGFV
jgi:flavin-dependent dehydrogenase